MATVEGRAVDRPAVSFYEVGGLKMDPSDPDPFNIYRDPSWQPLLALAEERTDLIRMRSPVRAQSHQAWDSPQAASEELRSEFFAVERYLDRGCRVTRTTLTIAGRVMTALTRRDRDVDTIWTTEHLLKSPADVEAYLQLPDDVFAETIAVSLSGGSQAELDGSGGRLTLSISGGGTGALEDPWCGRTASVAPPALHQPLCPLCLCGEVFCYLNENATRCSVPSSSVRTRSRQESAQALSVFQT